MLKSWGFVASPHELYLFRTVYDTTFFRYLLKTTESVRTRNFEVDKCHSRRGTIDDITAWIDLGQAQHMLGPDGSISGIS